MLYNRIFLSHRGLDKETVRQYRDVLSIIGLRPWMDESDLPAGPALNRALSEGMASSCAAVFFVSPHFEDKGYLTSEIDDALQQKVDRGKGFSIITLVIADDGGLRGSVPKPLKKFIWKEPRSHLEGIRYIIEALPIHLFKNRGYRPLQDLVPPNAKELALVGQNLASRLGLDQQRYAEFLRELNEVLAKKQLKQVILLMMTPKALSAIHPAAAKHLRVFTLPRLIQLTRDLPKERRIKVAFHPAATLSLLAVDWTRPERAFALVTPKFQSTGDVDSRTTILLEDMHFDSASLTRMLIDTTQRANEATEALLNDAPSLLERLLKKAKL